MVISKVCSETVDPNNETDLALAVSNMQTSSKVQPCVVLGDLPQYMEQTILIT